MDGEEKPVKLPQSGIYRLPLYRIYGLLYPNLKWVAEEKRRKGEKELAGYVSPPFWNLERAFNASWNALATHYNYEGQRNVLRYNFGNNTYCTEDKSLRMYLADRHKYLMRLREEIRTLEEQISAINKYIAYYEANRE